MSDSLPILYVEGKDDISVINSLLLRHGVDTDRGRKHLLIKDLESVELVLANMRDAIQAATASPVGFVVDIDIEVTHRWDAVRRQLQEPEELDMDPPPAVCPSNGFVGKLRTYPHPFGVWLMPDCRTDGQMLEHLIQSLVPAEHPLWLHAQSSTAAAARLIDDANLAVQDANKKWRRFSDAVRIKAEVRSWLAWQREPGVQFGAAINDHILGHDSPQAVAFVGWLGRLYGIAGLQV
jgi:hypothetical protein